MCPRTRRTPVRGPGGLLSAHPAHQMSVDTRRRGDDDDRARRATRRRAGVATPRRGDDDAEREKLLRALLVLRPLAGAMTTAGRPPASVPGGALRPLAGAMTTPGARPRPATYCRCDPSQGR